MTRVATLKSTARLINDTIVVRPGPEEAIKSGRTRRTWQKTLMANVADALSREGVPHDLRLDFGRIFITTPKVEDVLGLLPRVFGVASFSRVKAAAPADPAAIARIGAEAFTDTVRGRTYAVRCKRQGGHGFKSPEVERALGAALNGPGRVNLDRPEVTIRVEVLGRRALLTDERLPGVGGMPAGIQGRVLSLMSGGFDSAVAAWRAMRRGAEVDFLFCNLGGSAYERMVLQVAKLIHEAWGYGLRPRFYVVDFGAVMEDIRSRARPSHWQLVLKRQMYRAGNRVAAETNADALVTGESMGQVSSQTLGNLPAIDSVADRPVLRPLIGHDKREILDEAKRIGTAPLSQRVREYCALEGGRPVVRCRVEELDREEAKLDPALLASAIEERTVLDLAEVTPRDLRQPYLFVRDFPRDAVVVDCQPKHMYKAWHVPGAVHWEPDQLARGFRRLSRERTYVLYCTFGTQTPVIAEVMQQAGYEAYAFEGGLSRVKAAAESVPADRAEGAAGYRGPTG